MTDIMTETTPQIISSYQPGHHNSDLNKSISRLNRSAAYKDLSTIVIIPGIAPVPFRIFMALRSMYSPPNGKITWLGAEGCEVGEAYSTCIESVLAHPDLSKWKYVITIETDNCPPPDGIVKLLEQMEAHPEYGCIGGAYWTKGIGGVFQAWGDPKDPILNFRPQKPDPNGGLVECCGTGMGFTCFRLSMLKDPKIARPLFRTTANVKDGAQTQDLEFWKKARALGYRCAIDCSIRVGHYDHDGKFGLPKTMW